MRAGQRFAVRPQKTAACPQEAARLERLQGAVSALERSGTSFVGFVGKLTSNDAVRLAEMATQNLSSAEQAVLATTQE